MVLIESPMNLEGCSDIFRGDFSFSILKGVLLQARNSCFWLTATTSANSVVFGFPQLTISLKQNFFVFFHKTLRSSCSLWSSQERFVSVWTSKYTAIFPNDIFLNNTTSLAELRTGFSFKSEIQLCAFSWYVYVGFSKENFLFVHDSAWDRQTKSSKNSNESPCRCY